MVQALPEWPRHGPVVSLEAGEGPSLLLLHGLAASSRWWARNVPALATAFHVRAIDLPAFGASPRFSRFELARVPGQLVEVMDRLGIERSSVVGHSMGGLIAARLAADFPDRVERLVLVDAGFLSLDDRWHHRVTGLPRAVRWVTPEMLRTLAEDLWRVGPIGLTQATVQLLRADWGDVLARISAPTLVIWGDHDTICPPIIGDRIVERIPDARLVTFPGCGHNPMWEQADRFDRVVRDFLTDGGSRAAGAVSDGVT